MRKYLPVLLTLLLCTGCDYFKNPKVEGMYILHSNGEFKSEFYLEVGESMATYSVMGTEMSSEYKVEDNYLYLQSVQMPLRFQIESPNTLILDTKTLLYPTGKYVRLSGL